jgi:hypothetical protein
LILNLGLRSIIAIAAEMCWRIHQMDVKTTAEMCWRIHQMDVKTAFLNGFIEEEVYIEQP